MAVKAIKARRLNSLKVYPKIQPRVFGEPCPFLRPPRETRLDELASFATFGIDLKITPENTVKDIETDCLEFGMKGFEMVGIRSNGFSCESALIKCLQSYGLEQIAYLKDGLSKKGHLPFWFISPLRVPERPHYLWGKNYQGFVDTLSALQGILNDKMLADCFFEPLREYKPRTYFFNKEGLIRLVEDYNPEYAVIKPKKGMRGDDVEIASPEELVQRQEMFSFDYVLEPFVPSKPIHSEKTGKCHDGCMRYVLVVEEEKQGQIHIEHFKGYWRLCPRPISDYGILDAMRANLIKGAIPEGASEEELDLVKQEVEKFMPEFYRNLIRNIKA